MTERRTSGAGMVGAGLLLALFAGTAVLARAAATHPAGRNGGQRYEIDALVVQAPGGMPELCAGEIALSFPPRCGNAPVEPFSWGDVDGEETAYGATWARLHLVGTFDGEVFHLTQRPAPPRPEPGAQPTQQSPCPPPADGWAVVDETKIDEAAIEAAYRYADAQPDLAAVWFSWPNGIPETPPTWPAPTGQPSHRTAVLNAAFTGDVDRHASDLRARWGGALCVTRLSRTRRQLEAVSDDLLNHQHEATRAGLQLLGWGPDEIANVVKAQVLVADPAAQRWVDHRYGPGVVELDGALHPVG